MQITLEIPDDLAAAIPAGKDPARAALEALAIEGYRAYVLSESQIRRLLGFDTRMQVHALLQEYGVYFQYSMNDLEKDIIAADLLHAERNALRLKRAG